MSGVAPPPPLYPLFCPCETYEVRGAEAEQPGAMGVYTRIWRGEYVQYRPYDVWAHASGAFFLFFRPQQLDWHIGTTICEYTDLDCLGTVATAQ